MSGLLAAVRAGVSRYSVGAKTAEFGHFRGKLRPNPGQNVRIGLRCHNPAII
jgi:hypothetical protein